MPSGAKKRKAERRKKKELESVFDGSKEETKFQDASGITTTHPIEGVTSTDNIPHPIEGVTSTDNIPESEDKPGKEDIEVVVHDAELVKEDKPGKENIEVVVHDAELVKEEMEENLVPDLKGKKAIKGISFEDVKDHKAKCVSASDGPLLNIKEVVLPLPSKDVDIKENIEEDDSNTRENSITKAGLDFPTADESIQDVLPADNGVDGDNPKISSLHDVAVPSDLPSSVAPVLKEKFTNPTLSFHVHNADHQVQTADERIHDGLIVENMVNQVITKTRTENLSGELPVKDDAVPAELPPSIVPMVDEENPLPKAALIQLRSNLEGEIIRKLMFMDFLKLSDTEYTGEDENDVEMKKILLKMLSEVNSKIKLAEDLLYALRVFRESLSKSVDNLNATLLHEDI